MGCVLSTPTLGVLMDDRPSPDFFPEPTQVNVRQVNKSELTAKGDRHQQHVQRAQQRGQLQSSSSSTSELDTSGVDESNSPKGAASAQHARSQHHTSKPSGRPKSPAPVYPRQTSPFSHAPPPCAATIAAAKPTSLTNPSPGTSPQAAAESAKSAQHEHQQGAHPRPPTATQRKRGLSTRKSADSIGTAMAQKDRGNSMEAPDGKAKHSADQHQSGKQRLRSSQVLKIPEREHQPPEDNEMTNREASFLPPLMYMKQQRSQPQSPSDVKRSQPQSPSDVKRSQPQSPSVPMVMHAVPAARGGPSEPGLWVLRRTGCVRDNYVMTEVLGRGQFGIVSIAVEKTTGEKWACKSVSKRRVQGMHDFSMVDVLREVELLYLVGGHPGVVGLREVYEDEEDLHLIMELCQGGDWFEHLLTDGRYTESEAAQVVHGVLEALSYCHSLGVMHRDIKPENIMFTDRTRGATVKLTDFGLSTMFASEPLTEVLGSAYYVAPEVLRESYSKEADVWSLGVVLFIALGGYAPFDGKNEREVFTKILHEPLQFAVPSWHDISLAARDMIHRMLTKDPKARATVHELLEHPWFSQVLPPVRGPIKVMPRSPSLTNLGRPARPQVHLPEGGRFRVEVSASSEPSALSRSVSTAVRGHNKGVGWADDVVGGDRDSAPRPISAKRSLQQTHSRARRARSIAAVLEAASARGAALQMVPDAVVARLQQFAAMNAFKREARRVVATYLPEEEVVGLLTLFRNMDTDGDGVVSMAELCQALQQRGVHISDEHAKRLFKRSNLSGQEGVDYVEFLAATLHLGRLERDERLWRAFRHFDTDNTGFIDKANLVSALPHLGKKVDKAVDRILAEVDKDGDGRVCYAEFCDMLRRQPDPPELSHDPQVAAAAQAAPAGQWGAWVERTESGRLHLAVPPESKYPTRAPSLASSRQVSSNDRHSRSKSLFSSGATSNHTHTSSAGDATSGPTPHLLTNVLNQLHSTRAHSQAGGNASNNNSTHTCGSSNRSIRTNCSSRATSYHGQSSHSHAGSSRFGSMREAAAFATGHAHHPVERAAAAAVALYPEPSVSNDGEEDESTLADDGARRSWAQSRLASRQQSPSSQCPSQPIGDPFPALDTAYSGLLQQRREQLQEEGAPRPAVRTERSVRSCNNSHVQWALPEDDEEQWKIEEEEDSLQAQQGGGGVGKDGDQEDIDHNLVGSVDSNVGLSSRDNSVTGGRRGSRRVKEARSGKEKSLGEWASKNNPQGGVNMTLGDDSLSPLAWDASDAHSAQAAAAGGDATSDPAKASLSFRLLKVSNMPPGSICSFDSSPPTPSAKPSLPPVRTKQASPSKAQSEGGAHSSPSTNCSSPLFEKLQGPSKGQLAARAPHRLKDNQSMDSQQQPFGGLAPSK